MTFKYITESLADKTKYKSIVSAYQRNDLSIVLIRNKYWYEE